MTTQVTHQIIEEVDTQGPDGLGPKFIEAAQLLKDKYPHLTPRLGRWFIQPTTLGYRFTWRQAEEE